MKQKNLQSLSELNKIIEDINRLELDFNTKHGDSEKLLKEARENYYTILNKVEVTIHTIHRSILINCFHLII